MNPDSSSKLVEKDIKETLPEPRKKDKIIESKSGVSRVKPPLERSPLYPFPLHPSPQHTSPPTSNPSTTPPRTRWVA